MASAEIKFKCPECGIKDNLDEVMDNVIQYSPVEYIEKDSSGISYCDYDSGNVRSESGDIIQYECAHCGYVIKNKDEENIDNPEALFDWLKDRDMLHMSDTEI